MQDFKNYAIQFAATAGILYFMGTTDTQTLVQLGAISVVSSIVADQLMPYFNGSAATA